MWISTSQLEEGMVVDRDVKVNEIMLVKENTPLTSAHIRSLNRWNVTRISIIPPPDASHLKDLEFKSEDEKRFSDQLYLKAKTRLDLLYRNMESDPQMKMIKTCVLNHLEERFRGE